MTESTTVVVKNFPPSYSKEDRTDFMKTFNAIEVKCIISKYKKYGLVFAKFKTRLEAEAVIKYLHQTELEKGFFLSLEFAKGGEQSTLDKDVEAAYKYDESKDDQSTQRRILEDFLSKLNSWSRHLDLRHPPPHHLSYKYPPPTLPVLTNIARALAAVPKFYTQVLHLMNKMCLPCPFTDNYKIISDIVPDLLPDLFPGLKRENVMNLSKTDQPQEEISTEESEIESDPEVNKTTPLAIGVKRPAIKRNETGLKPKRFRFNKLPTVSKHEKTGQLMVKPEEVFERTVPKTEQKKIEVKVTSDLNAVAASRNETEIIAEGFEKMEPIEKSNQPKKNITENEEPTVQGCITEEELAENRISSKDQHILPVFKNYQPGLPSCRLYLKNLSKNVELAHLQYIYNRYYIEQQDEQGTMFDIRLMQEGRMKGQAFITLQNEKQAEMALKETNGYILKGKPIVVQYARAKPK